jgi:pimeloyl-ACP methyl ester carboxylesterase
MQFTPQGGAVRAADRTPAPADGAVVVALHSSGAGARQWAAWRPLLAPGVVLEAPDLIGYDGEAPWATNRRVTLDEEAGRIARRLETHGRRVHLIGHSYGAAVALRLAARWPERVHSLSLYEPVLFTLLRDDSDGGAWREITGVGHAIVAKARGGQEAAAAELFVNYWSGAGAWAALPPQRRAAVMARLPKVSAEFDALFSDRQAVESYRQLALPVRLVGGERSPAPARRVLARLAGLLPGARLEWLPGLGHMGPLEAPARVAEAFGLAVETHRQRLAA